ncbi:MAG: large conductance mechanosensitive channel protein MscL [Anaeromyxobacter sp.]
MLKGFKDFIARGNVVDLAVGVIMGGAFGGIVASLVADVITPFLGMLFGKPDFSGIALGSIMIGKFLNSVVSFLLVSIGVYFFIVTPMNRLKKAEAPPPPAGPTPDQKLLSEIRDLLAKRAA